MAIFKDKSNGGLITAPMESIAVSNPTMTAALQPQIEAIIAPDHTANLKSQQTQVNLPAAIGRTNSFLFSEMGSGKLLSDATSIRSLASIGIGSTDGKKMIVRKVPATASELLSIMNPQS